MAVQSSKQDKANRKRAIAAAMQPDGASVQTSTSAAMVRDPVSGNDEVLGHDSAVLDAANEVANEVLGIFKATEDDGQNAVARVARLFDLYEATDDDTLEKALNPKTHGFERNTTPYTYLMDAKKFATIQRADRNGKLRAILTAPTVHVAMAKGQEPKDYTGWNPRLRKANEINAAIRARNAEVKTRAKVRAEVELDNPDADEQEVKQLVEARLIEVAEETDEQRAERERVADLPLTKARAFAKRELLGDNGHGLKWLQDYAACLPDAIRTEVAIIQEEERKAKAEREKLAEAAARIEAKSAVTH